MPLAYSYQRYSSRKQASGDSIRRQTNMLNDWLKRNPQYTLDTTLVDKGVSGFRGKNANKGALADFLKEIKAGRIKPGSALIVESIDRLGRQTIDDMQQLVRQILLADVDLITLGPEKHLTKAHLNDVLAIMELVIYASRAREESERKSDRAKSNWSAKREQAAKEKKPFGKQGPSWLDIVDGKWTITKEKSATIKRIFKMALGGMGETAIAKALNQDGTPVGRP